MVAVSWYFPATAAVSQSSVYHRIQSDDVGKYKVPDAGSGKPSLQWAGGCSKVVAKF
jgi:hypothetical protein